MGILAKPLGFLLSWLYGIIGNYGVALIIVTVIVKLCLYPVYAKSIKSTMKMSEVQPKIQEIQQKYAKDTATMNEKLTELYKEEGVSMYGGCLPMLVQMIVIMGLFALLRNPMAYIDSDSMLFAIHEPFLWIQDLAQPDKWVLPILAAIATFIATSMSQNAGGAGASAQQAKMMTNIMKYFFPIMILWMARSYPAGLAIYWFGSQVIQIFYNIRFAKMRKASAEKRAKASKKKARA
ncbi:MAG: YidC/Oxa1 family membrane protein insertase [Firmicutes bacterium]|nr:YidC/Oxa1 family membrane protein insertase [Bacillota bacterium]